MTLFRKVFQNQSRPAEADEAPDEAALRHAFNEGESDAPDDLSPLMLDPFQVVKPQEAAEGEASDDVHGPDVDETDYVYADGDVLEEDYFDVSTEVDEDAASTETTSPEYEPDVEDELQATDLSEFDQNDGSYQSDEEIAACLDRALAAPVPDGGEQSDNETSVEEYAEEEDANDTTCMEPADADGETGTDDGRIANIAHFAQQQIASQTNEGTASDDSPAPSSGLDLSEGVGLEVVPTPLAGRAGRRAGRVKTRLLGFNRTGDTDHDPFGQAPEATATAQSEKYPVGWLVIVEGPGVGHSFSIFTGASMIGRGEDQVIRLDFGDNSISRNNHAAIAYDEEQNKFYIGHGGKSNIIRRNARPVLSTEELNHADLIRIGETTLRFVALCGSDFQWSTAGGEHAAGI